MRNKYKYLEEKVLKLHNEGVRPTQIRSQLSIPKSSYLHLRRKLKLESRAIRSNNINLTDYMRSLIIGTVLGDAHLMKGSTISSSISLAHCLKQKEYFDYKINVLKDLGGSIQKHDYANKKTGVMYHRYCYCSLSFKELKELRDIFYKNGKKIIPIDYLEKYFTNVSLAIMYMDDGTTQKYNTTIATQCFNKEELTEFVSLIKKKFNIEFTIQKRNSIRLKQKDSERFMNLIRTEISKISCMMYKLI